MSKFGAKELANLAIHCDKYDCIKALNLLLSWLFRQIIKSASRKEYGFLLLSAYLMRSPAEVLKIFYKCKLDLTPEAIAEWHEVEVLNMIPDHIKSTCSLSVPLCINLK